MISFSCQEQENSVEPKVNFEEASVFLSEMFTSTLRYSVENTEVRVSPNQEVQLSNFELTGNFLKQNYYPDFPDLDFSSRPNHRGREDNESHFNDTQLQFVEDMDVAMKTITSAEELYTLIEDFRDKAIQENTLTDEQKIEMLALVEFSYSLHEYLIHGGLEKINEILPKNVAGNQRGRGGKGAQHAKMKYDENGGGGCSVNWRNVWGSAVVSLGVNAVRGGVIGATTGTFTVPGVMTVAGGVGGAVLGGAAGFVGGALAGIATEFLLSCGR